MELGTVEIHSMKTSSENVSLLRGDFQQASWVTKRVRPSKRIHRQ